MKLIRISILAALLATTCTLFAQTVPKEVNYQGHVTDIGGIALGQDSAEARNVRFKIYKNATSVEPSDLLWGEEHASVNFADGRFSALLGGGAPIAGVNSVLATALHSPAIEYYIAISVADAAGTFNAGSEISPRQRIVSSAFALRAASADSVTSGKALSLGPSDNGLGYFDSASNQFNGYTGSGPVLFGPTGGALGTQNGDTQQTALTWNDAEVSISNSLRLHDQSLYLRTGRDLENGMEYDSELAGPFIHGSLGGALGFSSPTKTNILQWSVESGGVNPKVTITGDMNATGAVTAGAVTAGAVTAGAVTATGNVGGGSISTTGTINANGSINTSSNVIAVNMTVTDSLTAGNNVSAIGIFGEQLVAAPTVAASTTMTVASKNVATGEEATRIVHGRFTANSNTSFDTDGPGFSVSGVTAYDGNGAGHNAIKITFSPAFQNHPTVTANITTGSTFNHNGYDIKIYSVSSSEVHLIVINEGTLNTQVQDLSFNFIAVGRR